MKRITKNDAVKIKILKLLRNSESGISITAISEKLDVKYETVSSAVSFLENCGLLKLSTEKHGGLVYHYVKLSDLGVRVAEVMKDDVLNR